MDGPSEKPRSAERTRRAQPGERRTGDAFSLVRLYWASKRKRKSDREAGKRLPPAAKNARNTVEHSGRRPATNQDQTRPERIRSGLVLITPRPATPCRYPPRSARPAPRRAR